MNEKSRLPALAWTTLILSAALAYAVVRYVVFGGVGLEQLPLHVANKAVAFAGLILVGLASLGGTHERRKSLGLAGFALVSVHVLGSFAMLTPAYFPKLFLETRRLTWQAELSMLAAAAACVPLVWLFWATPLAAIPEPVGRRSLLPGLGRLVLVLTAIHVAALGAAGWIDFGTWPGSLPPITLLSFAAAVVLLLAKLVVDRRP